MRLPMNAYMGNFQTAMACLDEYPYDMVAQALRNMDPAVKDKLVKTYKGHREQRSLDPFTQTKAILDLASHAEIAEEKLTDLIAQIDSRSSTVMAAVPTASVPGFNPEVNSATPPTALANNTQGVTLTTQPPGPDGPSTSYVARGSQAERTIANNTDLEQFTWEPGSDWCLGCKGPHKVTICPNKDKKGFQSNYDRNLPLLKAWVKEKREGRARKNSLAEASTA